MLDLLLNRMSNFQSVQNDELWIIILFYAWLCLIARPWGGVLVLFYFILRRYISGICEVLIFYLKCFKGWKGSKGLLQVTPTVQMASLFWKKHQIL